jgi:hypothetical protein
MRVGWNARLSGRGVDPTPAMRSLRAKRGWDYWRRKCRPGRLPARADIDPAEFPDLLPYIVLIQVCRDPLDFVERVTGGEVLRHSTESSMNRSWLDYPGRGPDSKIWQHYEEVVRTGEPSFESVPYVGPHRDFLYVELLSCPLAEDGRTVDRVFSVVDYLPR